MIEKQSLFLTERNLSDAINYRYENENHNQTYNEGKLEHLSKEICKLKPGGKFSLELDSTGNFYLEELNNQTLS